MPWVGTRSRPALRTRCCVCSTRPNRSTAGACALVLEAVPSEAAQRVTGALEIPTIGVRGPHCDGQVLVSTEMLGLSAGARPKFAKRYANLRQEISYAVRTFAEEVASGDYPSHDTPTTGPSDECARVGVPVVGVVTVEGRQRPKRTRRVPFGD